VALGVCASTVHVRRWRLRRQGEDVPPAPRRTCKGRPPASLEGVDWSQTNEAIGQAVGLAPDYVSAMRARLRKAGQSIPRAPVPAGRLRERMVARAAAALKLVRPLLLEGLKVGEIARRLGLSYGVAGIAVRIAKGEETPVPKDEGPAPREEGEA